MARIVVGFVVFFLSFLITTATFADGVYVSELPLGNREIVGAWPDGAHILRLDSTGNVVSWSDSRGNDFLAPVDVIWQTRPLAIGAVDGERPLIPANTAQLAIKTISAEQIDATLRSPDGVELTYTMTPTRLGIRLAGRPLTTLRLRYSTSVEGCRIHAGDKVAFATADLGALGGAKHLVVDAERTRAMEITFPSDAGATWRLGPQAYPAQPFYLVADTVVKDGQTIWLSSQPIPAYDGALDLGLFFQRGFHPCGNPVAIAKLDSARFAPDAPVTLTFRKPINEIVKDGIVVAALIPISPSDPVEGWLRDPDWFNRLDQITPALMPVKVTQDAASTTLTVPAEVGSGAYRLRVWIVARGTAMPEILGGAKGAVTAFFPGFARGMWAAQDVPTGDAMIAVRRAGGGSVSITEPNLRHDFWRGETIHLLVQTRGKAAEVSPQITVRDAKSGQVIASCQIKLTFVSGAAATELALATGNLPPGEYRVEAAAPSFEPYSFSFAIAPPQRSGMAMVQSPMSVPTGLKTAERLGCNVWTDIITPANGHTPTWPDASATSRGLLASDASLPAAALPARSELDDLVRGNWFWLQAIHSRQLDFYFFHSIPEQVEENYRRHLVYAQLNQRYPSMLGLVLGYDLLGLSPAGSWGGGWETFASAGTKRNAILQKTWEQYWKDAQAKGATAADEPRLHSLFNAHVIGDFYAQSAADLHDHFPRQRHTSSNTADHADIANGLYLPVLYEKLDLRYLETWNDQVYPCSAVDYQEMFWTSLLAMERREHQPIWVTVPTAPQPGTHMRRLLQTSARGATGSGYGAEGGAGASGESANAAWSVDPSRSNARTCETLLSADVTTRYGAFFNAFLPEDEIAILYPTSNGGSNFATYCPIYSMYSVLAQLNRPAKLLTEDKIAAGGLARMKALVLVRQQAALPPKTIAAIEQFIASGGKVIADTETTVSIKGLKKVDEIFVPWILLFVNGNVYHQIISHLAGIADERAWQSAYRLLEKTVGYFRPERIKPIDKPLLAALGDAGREPLEPIDGRAMVSHKVAGDATLVFVTNENIYPFHEMLSDAQLKALFFRRFMEFGSIYYKDVRWPRVVTLRLRDDLAQAPPHIYDVFAGKEIKPTRDAKGQWTITVDLATVQGRALLIRPREIDAPTIAIGSREDSNPLATIVVRSEVPLPVRIRVGDQEIFRASNVLGSCDMFAIAAGDSKPVTVEVTELITGQSRRGSIPVTKAAEAPIAELPPIQITDAVRARSVLASKNLAIYVDARQAGQLEAAQKLASKLGNGAQVVFNPKVEDYVLDWDLPPDLENANERIRTQGLLARRRPIRANFQWVGAELPSLVWNRPAIVFGNAGDNRLIADMNSVTLLPRPATPEAIGAGRAWIGVAASPFWYKQDVVVALCGESGAESAALESLAKIAVEKEAPTSPTPSSDDEAIAERRRQLGFEPLKYPEKLTELETKSVESSKPNLTPCVPVVGLVSTNDGALVTLGAPGRNMIRIDSTGKELWRTTTAGWYQPLDFFANASGESVARDNGATFLQDGSIIWRHDASGNLRWKMIGTPVASPAADGSLWTIVDSKALKRISPAGEIVQTFDLQGDKLLALARDGGTVFVQRPSKQPNFERVDASVVAIDVASSKPLWTIEQCEVMESRLSDDGKLLACIERENFWHRDDIARSYASRVTVIDTASGKVVMRTPIGQWINQLLISPDGSRIMARLGGYSDVVYLADVASGSVRQLKLPEPGGWSHAFSRDGKTLWVACEKLYRIDADSLAVHEAPVANARILRMTALPSGLLAGTTDGRVLWLNADGAVDHESNLAAGIAVTDIRAELSKLRDAKLVDSPTFNPHEFPATINLPFEFPRGWSTPLTIRADGCIAPHFAVHAPVAGKYRFTIPLANPKNEGDKFGILKLIADDEFEAATQPLNGDKWQQTGVLTLKAGSYDIRVQPQGWTVPIQLIEMKIEKAD